MSRVKLNGAKREPNYLIRIILRKNVQNVIIVLSRFLDRNTFFHICQGGNCNEKTIVSSNTNDG